MQVWLSSGLRLSLLAAFIGLAIACSPSEGGMELIHVDRPPWYRLFQLTTFIYLFAAIPLALRSSDPRMVAALPIIGNATIASYAVSEMLRALEAIGYEPKTGGAVAAGLAESIFPVFVGAVIAVWMSLLIAFSPWFADVRTRRTRVGSLALVVAATGLAAVGALAWYLSPWVHAYRPGREGLALPPLALTTGGLAMAVVALVWPARGRSSASLPRRWFLAFGASAGAVAWLLWLAGERLTAFAAGGAPS